MLVATTKDTSNTLVLVAFAICGKENASNYSFLPTERKKNPHMAALLSSTGTTIYSDEHQGISAALKTHASRCIHRLCLPTPPHQEPSRTGNRLGETLAYRDTAAPVGVLYRDSVHAMKSGMHHVVHSSNTSQPRRLYV